MLCQKIHVPSTYPKVLQDVSRYIHQRLVTKALCKESTDGRINSIQDEDTVIAYLNEEFRVQKAKPRHWYDASIHDPTSDKWIPVNIKVTEGGCDNALNKKAIVYSFTDLTEDQIPSSMHFNKMVEMVENNMKDTRDPFKEYYYMCIDKTDKEVLIRSICDVREFKSNPQNWMQIHWKKEKEISLEADASLCPPKDCFARIKYVLASSLFKLLASSYKLLDVNCKNDHLEEDVLAIVERIKITAISKE